MSGLASFDADLWAAADRHQSTGAECYGVTVDLPVEMPWLDLGVVHGTVETDAGSLEGLLTHAELDDGSTVDLAQYTVAQRTVALSAADSAAALEMAAQDARDTDDYYRELAWGAP